MVEYISMHRCDYKYMYIYECTQVHICGGLSTHVCLGVSEGLWCIYAECVDVYLYVACVLSVYMVCLYNDVFMYVCVWCGYGCACPLLCPDMQRRASFNSTQDYTHQVLLRLGVQIWRDPGTHRVLTAFLFG